MLDDRCLDMELYHLFAVGNSMLRTSQGDSRQLPSPSIVLVYISCGGSTGSVLGCLLHYRSACSRRSSFIDNVSACRTALNVDVSECQRIWCITRAFTLCCVASRRSSSGEALPCTITGDRNHRVSSALPATKYMVLCLMYQDVAMPKWRRSRSRR